MQSKKLILALIVVLAICVAALVLLLSSPSAERSDVSMVPVQAGNIGGVIQLTDQNGQAFSSDSVKDKHKIIYFGFTHCPAICPTELQKIMQALSLLGDDAKGFQPVFITVDPARDTVAVMKDYVTLFDKNLIGLTGTQEEIEAVKKSYKVYGAKTQDPNASEYTVDHSSFIYVTDGDDKVVDLFKAEDTAKVMAARLRYALSL